MQSKQLKKISLDPFDLLLLLGNSASTKELPFLRIIEVLFLTYQLAGNEWLASRLSLFSRCSLGKQLNFGDLWQADKRGDGITVMLDTTMPPANTRFVNVIRNPLAMQAIVTQGYPHESFDLPSVVSNMVANAEFAKSVGNLNVRLEDFAAFPVVQLKAICDFFGQPCSVALVRAFLDADRPIRKSRGVIRVSPVLANAVTSQSHAEPQLKKDRTEVRPSDRVDLFSWVDEVSGIQAQSIVAKHHSFFASYYPEVLRVCQSTDRMRRVG